MVKQLRRSYSGHRGGEWQERGRREVEEAAGEGESSMLSVNGAIPGGDP